MQQGMPVQVFFRCFLSSISFPRRSQTARIQVATAVNGAESMKLVTVHFANPASVLGVDRVALHEYTSLTD